MTTRDDVLQSNALPADRAGDAEGRDSAALEWRVPSFEDVLAALPPEQRELAIIAANGC